MKYRGYTGHISYDAEAKIFHGEVVGLSDIITFQGKSTDELERALRDSIDTYIQWCAERGEQPEKTFSGTFNLRLPPELHARISLKAKVAGISLNSYIIKELEENE